MNTQTVEIMHRSPGSNRFHYGISSQCTLGACVVRRITEEARPVRMTEAMIDRARQSLAEMEQGLAPMDAERYTMLMGWIADWQARLGYDY